MSIRKARGPSRRTVLKGAAAVGTASVGAGWTTQHCTAAEAHGNLILTKALDLSAKLGKPVRCDDWAELETKLD